MPQIPVGIFLYFLTPILSTVSWIMFTAMLTKVPRPLQGLFYIKPTNLNDNGTNPFPIITMGLVSSCLFNAPGMEECGRVKGRHLGVLPEYTGRNIIIPPPKGLLVSIYVSLGSTVLHAIVWFLLLFKPSFPEPFYTHWVPLVFMELSGLLAFITGLPAYLAVFMLYRKTSVDFNAYNLSQGQTEFVASTGTDFLLSWLVFGLLFHCMTVQWVLFFKYTVDEPKPAGKA